MGGIPRKGVLAEALAMSRVAVLGTRFKTEALGGSAAAGFARRVARRSAKTVGVYGAVVGKAATEVALAAGESIKSGSESAKQVAVQGAQRTTKAILAGGRLASMHATAYVRANAGAALAQLRQSLLKYSEKLAQTASDMATRGLSKPEQIQGDKIHQKDGKWKELQREKCHEEKNNEKRLKEEKREL